MKAKVGQREALAKEFLAVTKRFWKQRSKPFSYTWDSLSKDNKLYVLHMADFIMKKTNRERNRRGI